MVSLKRSSSYKVMNKYVKASVALCAEGIVGEQPFLITGSMLKKLGIGGTMLLSYIMWEYVVAVNRSQDEQGFVWIPYCDIKESLNMGPSKQSKLFEALKQAKLIDVVRSGHHGRRMVRVRCDETASLLLESY